MIDSLLTFDDVKKDRFIIENIRWDLEPKALVEPKYRATPQGVERREDRPGYIFYIDAMDKEPRLFVMRHTASEFGKTVARIDEAPDELIAESMNETKERQYFNMYPIGKRLGEWLKKELGAA